MNRLTITVLLSCLAMPALSADSFKMCWSLYTGWMPWSYAVDNGIVDKWAEKYGIEIEVVQFNDYVESLNQYTSGNFDACTMTNMDALIMPAASSVDTTALIVGDVSNGNDAIVLKGADSLSALKGQNVNLVELSVSHYLLARGLESIGLSEADVTLVNSSDADIVAAYGTGDVTSVVTWNPLLNEIDAMPESNIVYDSSMIPGEILDLLVVNTQTLEAYPELGSALTGAWFEVMELMSSDETADSVKSYIAEAAGSDLASYNAQLETTTMFYDPAQALELINSDELVTTMQNVSDFSFDQGMLGDEAPDAGFIGIQLPAGSTGDKDNIMFRFNPVFTQMAADGEL